MKIGKLLVRDKRTENLSSLYFWISFIFLFHSNTLHSCLALLPECSINSCLTQAYRSLQS